MAWIAPIGIPAPLWGVQGNVVNLASPTPPSPWAAEVSSPPTYYVEPAFPGATDIGRTYGTPAAPRATIPTSLPAGARVFVHGNYSTNHTGGSALQPAGTEANPVWVLAYNPAARPSFKGNMGIAGQAEYIIFSDINCDYTLYGGSWEIAPSSGVGHMCFRNMTLEGIGDFEGTDVNGGTMFILQTGCKHMVFHNLNILKTGDVQYTASDSDATGIEISTTAATTEKRSNDIWIVGCNFDVIGGSAMMVGGGSVDSTPDNVLAERVYVGLNVATRCAQSPFAIKRGKDIIISQNVAHNIRRNNPFNDNSGGVETQYGPINLWIIYNTVYNCQAGIKSQSINPAAGKTGNEIHVIGNLIYNIHDTINYAGGNWRTNSWAQAGVAIPHWGYVPMYVVNNTIHDYDCGVMGNPNSGRMYAEGNIFTGRNGAVLGLDMYHDGDNNLATYRHNIVEEIAGACWWKMDPQSATTVAGINAIGGLKTNNSNVVPFYTDPPSGAFTLTTEDQEFTANVSNVCTAVAHGLETNQMVMISNPVPANLPGNLSENVVYYFIKLTNDTFSLTEVLSGSAIDITSAGTGPHTLKALSNGINYAGAEEHTAYAAFEALYGIDIRVDRNGGTRPTLGSWDIGAYEYGSGSAPAHLAPPYITGIEQIHETLTAVAGVWTNSPILTYQWNRNGVPIIGATSLTYVLPGGSDPGITAAGQTYTITETATNDFGNPSATSLPTGVIAGVTAPTIDATYHFVPITP